MIKYCKDRILDLDRYQIALIAIVVLAFVLRIWGIDFGLPYIYHTDEWFEVKRALKLGAGNFDFGRITKGGYFYLLFLEYGFYFAILRICNVVHSSEQFLYRLLQDPTSIWLIGRITTAFVGTLNCFLLYVLGKYAFSKTVGLFASFFMAIYILHVASSHYITVDIPLVTLITMCFIIMYWRHAGTYRNKDYMLLGVLVAIAVMTKITAAVVIFPIFYFHFCNIKLECSRVTAKSYILNKRFIMFLVVLAVVYILGNPGILVKFGGIVKWAGSFVNPYAANRDSLYPQLSNRSDSPFNYYLGVLFPVKYFILTIFIFGGFFICLRKYCGKQLFLFFLIPYCFFLVSSKSKELIYARYVLPIIPILFIYAGVFFEYLLKPAGKFRIYRYMLITTILIGGIYPVLKDSIVFDMNKVKPDTRTLAKEWVEKNIPADSVVYITGGLTHPSTMTVSLNMNPELMDEMIFDRLLLTGEIMSSKKDKFYQIKKKVLVEKKTFHLVLTHNRKQLENALNKKMGDYIVLTGKAKGPFTLDANRETFPEIYRLLKWADSDDFKLINTFKPTKGLTGPVILIYKCVVKR
ncbi:MAG: phospholipid carrier-dependent glycosyltransferase [Candidatus Brocadiaceae bacterium]|nr:phospholipid carrier-dependent glycosyltransferase [Candidatus Brocadiaceae bacterium]